MSVKTYFSRVVGSTYYDSLGNPHVFIGGKLTTDNELVQKELEAIIKGGNPLFFSAADAANIPAVAEQKQQLAEMVNKAAAAAHINAQTDGKLVTPAGTTSVTSSGSSANTAISGSK